MGLEFEHNPTTGVTRIDGEVITDDAVATKEAPVEEEQAATEEAEVENEDVATEEYADEDADEVDAEEDADDEGELATEEEDEEEEEPDEDLSKLRAGAERYEQYRPLINEVEKSDVLRRFLYHRTQGMTDQRIIEGMFLLLHPEYQNLTPEQLAVARNGKAPQQQQSAGGEDSWYDSLNEGEQDADPKTQALEAKIAALEGQLNQITGQSTAASIRTYNDRILNTAIAGNGLDPTVVEQDQNFVSALVEEWTNLFGNTPFDKYKLTPQQSNSLVVLAMNRLNGQTSQKGKPKMKAKPSIPAAPSTDDLIRQAKAPRVAPSKTRSVKKQGHDLPALDNVRKTDRVKNWNTLGR